MPSENAIKNKILLGYDFRGRDVDVDIEKDNTKDILTKIAISHTLSCKEAAYHLLFLNSFAKCAGAAGCSSISQSPQLYVYASGRTMYETIKLNMTEDAQEKSSPMWERDGIKSYYAQTEKVDEIGYDFFPNRFCRYEWDGKQTHSLLYAPHKIKVGKNSSKEICKELSELYSAQYDRYALVGKAQTKKDDGQTQYFVKYNKIENWINMILGVIVSDEITSISIAPQSIKQMLSSQEERPVKININMFCRDVEPKSASYFHIEKLSTQIPSVILCDQTKKLYLQKYIQFVRQQFTNCSLILTKYYKLTHKDESQAKSAILLSKRMVSLEAEKYLNKIYKILSEEANIDEQLENIYRQIQYFTKTTLFKAMEDNILAASKAYNSIVFGGTNDIL